MPTPRRALVVIDVQNEYFDGPLEVQYPPRDDSLARILEAIDTAEQAGIPVAITGYMTNNCVLGTAEGAEPHGVKRKYCQMRPVQSIYPMRLEPQTPAGFMKLS